MACSPWLTTCLQSRLCLMLSWLYISARFRLFDALRDFRHWVLRVEGFSLTLIATWKLVSIIVMVLLLIPRNMRGWTIANGWPQAHIHCEGRSSGWRCHYSNQVRLFSQNIHLSDSIISYRTLSIHVDEKPNVTDKKAVDPSDVIRQIDVHIIDDDQVFHRFSTHPKLGLEHTAVERKSKDGKNIISPPPTQWALIINENWARNSNYIEPQILEEVPKLRLWRVQFSHVDCLHRHHSMFSRSGIYDAAAPSMRHVAVV